MNKKNFLGLLAIIIVLGTVCLGGPGIKMLVDKTDYATAFDSFYNIERQAEEDQAPNTTKTEEEVEAFVAIGDKYD